MTKRELSILANNVDTNDDNISFLSSFHNYLDVEVAAIIVAWMSNGVRGEQEAARKLIECTMNAEPSKFASSYINEFDQYGDSSFFGIITFSHLHNLIVKIRDVLNSNASIQTLFRMRQSEKKKNRIKYAHDALASIFSGGTCLPTSKSTCAFYRYNLFLYWMAYKMNIWQSVDITNAIIPCRDDVFARAHKLGVTRHQLKTNLPSAIKLTKTAHSWFGNDFYKMYELLNFSNE